MTCLEKLREYLDQNHVEYSHTVHPLAYTAREVASAEHLPPREIAKTVVIWTDSGYHMAVIPANKVVDFQELRTALGFTHARLATEQELGQIFTDCDLGAMPPFGNLYDMHVYVDSSLAQDEHIAFNAGTHRDVVHMRFEDYKGLVHPTIVRVARELTAQAW